MYLFFPCILFSVAATTPITTELLSVPLLVGIGSLTSGLILYVMLYRLPMWPHLTDPTRAGIMLGGMFGNTFNIGAPVLVFFYGPAATRYAVFNDMLMTMPLVWSLGVWIATRLGSHSRVESYPSVWRVMFSMPPIWAFMLGMASQQLGLNYPPLVKATGFIGQATIPVTLFILGLRCRGATRAALEILSAAVKRSRCGDRWAQHTHVRPGEAQFASVADRNTADVTAAARRPLPAGFSGDRAADRLEHDTFWLAAVSGAGWCTIASSSVVRRG
jgi:hypothetical protein